MLGLTNPKAYLAFASLFASFVLVGGDLTRDSLLKWGGVVIVMIMVDIVWLWIGIRLGRLDLSVRSERAINGTVC